MSYMSDLKLPPTPKELMLRAGGPNVKDMFSADVNMGALPVPSPQDIEKVVGGFVPSPADVGKLGQEMVTGGITDKVLIVSAILTPPLLLGGIVVSAIGVILLASKGGAP